MRKEKARFFVQLPFMAFCTQMSFMLAVAAFVVAVTISLFLRWFLEFEKLVGLVAVAFDLLPVKSNLVSCIGEVVVVSGCWSRELEGSRREEGTRSLARPCCRSERAPMRHLAPTWPS